MAKAVLKIRGIALTMLQETLRRRVLYVVAFMMLITLVIIISGQVALRMATESGETSIATGIREGFVRNVLGIWSSTAAVVLAIFLGAVGVSSEVTAKTIVNVLSRPVDRATYLMGRWIGTLAFLWAFQFLGILIALFIALAYDVRYSPLLWVGVANLFVSTLFFSGVSLGFSVFMPPVLAGGCTILISSLPGLVSDLTRHPRWIARVFADAAYYLAPATMPVDLIGGSFTRELVHPEYRLYFEVMAENFLYTVVVFILACAIFARRELRLR